MKKTIAILLGVLAVTTAPTTAIAQGSAATVPIVVTAKYRSVWDRGNKMEQEGLADLEKANRSQIDASAGVVKSQNRIESSQEQSANAQAEFRRLASSPPTVNSGKEANDWAALVKAAAVRWVKYDKRAGTSDERLDEHSEDRVWAEKVIAKAQAKIDKGRALMADAERKSSASGGQ